ncbi:MAG: hypothetical protein R3A52_18625 [Polyangiales bacterium]
MTRPGARAPPRAQRTTALASSAMHRPEFAPQHHTRPSGSIAHERDHAAAT